MTCEIVVMNRGAIAFAADSAVTVGNKYSVDRKIYSTSNKLFKLSPYHSVGIMVYGNAQLVGIPWETIIKVYSHDHIRKEGFSTIKEYGEDFIAYLQSNVLLSKSDQKKAFYFVLINYLGLISDKIKAQISKIVDKRGKVTKAGIKRIVAIEINDKTEKVQTYPLISNLTPKDRKQICKECSDTIEDAIQEVFQDLAMSKNCLKNLKRLCLDLFMRDIKLPSGTGVVIAGFGEKEIYPSLFSFEAECILNNKLKYKETVDCRISFDRRAAICPFAESDIALTFVEGISPYYSWIESYLRDAFQNYSSSVIKEIEKNDNFFSDQKTREDLLKKFESLNKDLIQKFIDNMDETRKKFVDPMIDAVAFLPRKELAEMAESLVNLTSLKKKISLGISESVGGPIDVAVISKGDGFIWVKQKNCFE